MVGEPAARTLLEELDLLRSLLHVELALLLLEAHLLVGAPRGRIGGLLRRALALEVIHARQQPALQRAGVERQGGAALELCAALLRAPLIALLLLLLLLRSHLRARAVADPRREARRGDGWG